MELLKQAAIAKLRGEASYFEMLQDIVIEEVARIKNIERIRRQAENVILTDEDR